MTRPAAIVVGAGPAGLAAAAELGRRGIPALVLERGERTAARWHEHYRSLRLHTVRTLSGLPGTPIPKSCGRWVSGGDFVSYLERYAAAHKLRIQPGTAVQRIERAGDRWRLATGDGAVEARTVVVATGYNHTPVLPSWAADKAGLPIIHSSEYRDPAPYRGRRVLVVGAGNSGTDIALDLARGGARRVWLSVRTPPALVPRQVLGVPAQVAAIGLIRLPPQVGDAAAGLERRLFAGGLAAYGLPQAGNRVFTRHREDGRIPILDIGFRDAVRAYRLRIVPAVDAVQDGRVTLRGGAILTPDAVIAATGYRADLWALVGDLGVLDERGLPSAGGGKTPTGQPGIHFTGYRNPLTGALRELRFEAPAIATAVAAEDG
jgi:putative flavoprotein involved in K+ transport